MMYDFTFLVLTATPHNIDDFVLRWSIFAGPVTYVYEETCMQ